MDNDKCKFSEAWRGKCSATAGASGYCEKHEKMTCCVCKAQATHDCDHTGQFVCGAPLCNDCEGHTDTSKPSGGWGFMNHTHRRKPSAAPVAERASNPASPAPVAAIKTWQERMAPGYIDGGADLPEERAMKAEIADLRAALAASAPQAQAEPVAWACPLNERGEELEHPDVMWETECGWDEKYKPFPLYATPAAPVAPSVQADVTKLLDADELAALRRFAETCEDDESYDVPKEKMRRLASIGVIESKGFRRYQITDFGDFVLEHAAATPALQKGGE